MKKLLVLFLLISCNDLSKDPLCTNKAKITKDAFTKGCFVGSKFFIEYGTRNPIPQGQLGELFRLCDEFYVNTSKLEM